MLRIQPRLLLMSLICVGSANLSTAQDPPVKKSGSQNDLTEGLLDLLREPTRDGKQQNASPPGNPSSSSPSSSSPLSSPSSSSSSPRSLDGEDIGSAKSNPLAEVQMGMNALAQWLRSRPQVASAQDVQRDVALQRNKELQRDVVLRLDELIEQLEKQSSQSNSASASSQTTPSSQTQPPSQSNASAPSPANGQGSRPAGSSSSEPSAPPGEGQRESDSNDPSSPSRSANQPGQSNGGNEPQAGQNQPGQGPMRPRNVTVDLNDPRALQRSAWGNLPERTREQMQSRMVERFLPPYRDEIEAYYRALSTSTRPIRD